MGARDARRRVPLDLCHALARELHDVDRLSSILRSDSAGSGDQPGEAHRGAVGHRRGRLPGRQLSAALVRVEQAGIPCATSWRSGSHARRAGLPVHGQLDLCERTGRRPFASINFITAHDGFTLHDLVSYNEKHNEANGQDNRDGENHNRS